MSDGKIYKETGRATMDEIIRLRRKLDEALREITLQSKYQELSSAVEDGTKGGGMSTASADLRYLKLAADNDPLTGSLQTVDIDVNGGVSILAVGARGALVSEAGTASAFPAAVLKVHTAASTMSYTETTNWENTLACAFESKTLNTITSGSTFATWHPSAGFSANYWDQQDAGDRCSVYRVGIHAAPESGDSIVLSFPSGGKHMHNSNHDIEWRFGATDAGGATKVNSCCIMMCRTGFNDQTSDIMVGGQSGHGDFYCPGSAAGLRDVVVRNGDGNFYSSPTTPAVPSGDQYGFHSILYWYDASDDTIRTWVDGTEYSDPQLTQALNMQPANLFQSIVGGTTSANLSDGMLAFVLYEYNGTGEQINLPDMIRVHNGLANYYLGSAFAISGGGAGSPNTLDCQFDGAVTSVIDENGWLHILGSNPVVPLDVEGDADIGGILNVTGQTTGPLLVLDGSGGAQLSFEVDSVPEINSSGVLSLQGGNVRHVSIVGGGGLGIGQAIQSSEALRVDGTVEFLGQLNMSDKILMQENGANDGMQVFHDNSVGDSDKAPVLRWKTATSDGAFQLRTQLRGRQWSIGNGLGATEPQHLFGLTTNSHTIINSSYPANLGVAFNTPTSTLHVGGTAEITSTVTLGSVMVLSQMTTPGATPSSGTAKVYLNTATGEVSALKDDNSVVSLEGGGGGGTDTDAIHDNVPSEISAITTKTTLTNGDFFILEDSEDSNAKKKCLFSQIAGAGGGGGTTRLGPWNVDLPLDTPATGDDDFSTTSLTAVNAWVENDPSGNHTYTAKAWGLQSDGAAANDLLLSYLTIAKPAASTTYTIVGKFNIMSQAGFGDNAWHEFGIGIMEDTATTMSGTGMVGVSVRYETLQAPDRVSILPQNWTDYANFLANLGSPALAGSTSGTNPADASVAVPLYLRVRKLGTTYGIDYSNDGKSWRQLYSGAAAAVGANDDEVGFWSRTNGVPTDIISCEWFRVIDGTAAFNQQPTGKRQTYLE